MTLVPQEFLVLAASHGIALLSPGPDFFLLVGNTGKHGVRTGAGTALGIALANALYITCALTGFTLLTSNPLLQQSLRWLGAGYLLYLAWAFFRSGLHPRIHQPEDEEKNGGDLFTLGLRTGFVSGALNPKNGVFYLGLFSAAVSADTGSAIRLFYGAWMFLVVLGWNLLLVRLLRSRLALALLWRRLPLIEIGAATCLALIAVLLLLGN